MSFLNASTVQTGTALAEMHVKEDAVASENTNDPNVAA